MKEIPISLLKLIKLEYLNLQGNNNLQFPPISLVESLSDPKKQAAAVIEYLKANKPILALVLELRQKLAETDPTKLQMQQTQSFK